MQDTVTYRKSIPSEIIEPGDLIMIDIETGSVKRAYISNLEDMYINSRLIIGVCVESDNSGNETIIIDGGDAKSDNVDLDTQTIIIDGGDAGYNNKEVIKVAYSGRQLVNVYGYVDIGDTLCISKEPGKAQSKDYLKKNYYNARSIGKVVKFTNNKEQVVVLLDIE